MKYKSGFWLVLILLCMLTGMGCGKKAPPLPPEKEAGISNSVKESAAHEAEKQMNSCPGKTSKKRNISGSEYKE